MEILLIFESILPKVMGGVIPKNKIFSFCIALLMPMVCCAQAVDSLCYRIRFGCNSSIIETWRTGNAAALSGLRHDLDSLRGIPGVNVSEVITRGSASWEGNVIRNEYLSRKRARYVAYYLKLVFGIDAFQKESYLFDSEFSRIVSCSDSKYKSDVLSIIGNGATTDVQKIRLLKSLDAGRSWKWLKTEIFPTQRFADIFIKYSVEADSVPVSQDDAASAGGTGGMSGFNDISEPDRGPTSFFLALKNNLIFDAALVANLGLEIGMGKHFSLDIPVTYSPYTVSRNYSMRTLSVQPELRYYLKQGCQGHFFGIHGNFAYYNIVTPFNTKTRFQDRDGKHPLYGGGISYGYSLPFSKSSRWGIEFTVGIGYAYLDYDCFYNVDNGAWFNRGTKHYLGVDKLGATIYYRFIDNGKRRRAK